MSRDTSLRYRVRCSESPDHYGDGDSYEYFGSQEEATKWARKAARAGRFKQLMIQDMSPQGINGWNTPVIDEIVVRARAKKSN
jgi:hypothetical protein